MTTFLPEVQYEEAGNTGKLQEEHEDGVEEQGEIKLIFMFFLKCFFLVMPKYWGKQISHTGDSPKWVKSKRRREKEEKKRRETERW